MKLHFLGTTGYHPNNVRQTACLMIPERGIVLDAGTGMFRVRDLIQTDTLDIFLSHVHLDHCVGLTFLYDVLLDKNLSRVTVHVDPQKIDAIQKHLYSEPLFPIGPNFEFAAISPDQPLEMADGTVVTTIPLEHPGGCYGFRFDWPAGAISGQARSMAYITDTTAVAGDPYVKPLGSVDTLIHECYFSDGNEELAAKTGHSCLTPVAQVAAECGAGRTFLVHINPLDESECPLDLESVKHLVKNIAVARDKMVIDL